MFTSKYFILGVDTYIDNDYQPSGAGRKRSQQQTGQGHQQSGQSNRSGQSSDVRNTALQYGVGRTAYGGRGSAGGRQDSSRTSNQTNIGSFSTQPPKLSAVFFIQRFYISVAC